MKTNVNVNNTLADMEAKVIKFENLAKKNWEITDYEVWQRFRYIAVGIRYAMNIVRDRAAEPHDDY